MCKNATQTAASLMKAVEPTLINLLTLTGIAATPQGEAAISAYNTALEAVEGWTPGTTSADVEQVINAFTQVFNTLPVPSDLKTLVDIITGGVVAVLGIIQANSPAPATTEATTHEETQAAHIAFVAHDTTVKVQKLVPSFKRSIFHSASSQYTKAWNEGVDKLDPKYATLKV